MDYHKTMLGLPAPSEVGSQGGPHWMICSGGIDARRCWVPFDVASWYTRICDLTRAQYFQCPYPELLYL